MRHDCRNFESRTYRTGETVRMCRLDLAPEAPWRCPVDCPKYDRKLGDGGWVTGGLANIGALEPPPGFDEHSVHLLDEAENIVNAIGPEVIEEVKAQRLEEQRREQKTSNRRWWWPF